MWLPCRTDCFISNRLSGSHCCVNGMQGGIWLHSESDRLWMVQNAAKAHGYRTYIGEQAGDIVYHCFNQVIRVTLGVPHDKSCDMQPLARCEVQARERCQLLKSDVSDGLNRWIVTKQDMPVENSVRWGRLRAILPAICCIGRDRAHACFPYLNGLLNAAELNSRICSLI